MTKALDIINFMDEMYPQSLAEDFDNVGLLIGRAEKEIKKVMIMLDADNNTVNEAIESGVDMIITHHPVIFSSMKKITNDLYLKLIENKITLFSAHTNLDTANGGVNDCLAKALNLTNVSKLRLNNSDTLMARTGFLNQPLPLSLFLDVLKIDLKIKNLRYIGDDGKIINKVGLIGGSAVEFMDDIFADGCDAFITSDIKYHEAQKAAANNYCIIDAGHFETENLICDELFGVLSKEFTDVKFYISARKTSYIKYG